MDLYHVRLVALGRRKIETIKTLRRLLGLQLRQAKEWTDSVPRSLHLAAREDLARLLQCRLEALGDTVELERVGQRRYCVDPARPERGDQPLCWVECRGREVVSQSARGRSARTFPDGQSARQAFDDELAEYRADGWVIVDDELAVTEALSARDHGLEQALSHDPTPQRHLVYGDWLQHHGDPRGELVALQHARGQAAAEEKRRLLAREITFFSRHRGHLLGDLVWGVAGHAGQPRDRGVRHHGDQTRGEGWCLHWRWGFVETAEVRDVTEGSVALGLPRLLRTLFALPAARMIGALCSALANNADLIDALLDVGLPDTLRRLQLGAPDSAGDGEEGGETDWRRHRSFLGDLGPLYPRLARLQQLRLYGRGLRPGPIDLPALRHFALVTPAMTGDLLQTVAEARWPALETLELTGLERRTYDDDLEVMPVDLFLLAPVFAARGLPCLRHLALRETARTEEIVVALARSSLLGQLETLDLSWGNLGGEAAGLLERHRPAFAHLKRLNLEGNRLATATRRRLQRQWGPMLHLGAQRAR